MKALSIKQPWAWLICTGYKDIENRDWAIGRNPQHGPTESQKADFSLQLPTRIFVHASKTEDYQEMHAAFSLIERLHGQSDGNIIKANYTHFKALGAIIGDVAIVNCVSESKSPWFTGKYGLVLTQPHIYKYAIPWRGQLGFFPVDYGKLIDAAIEYGRDSALAVERNK